MLLIWSALSFTQTDHDQKIKSKIKEVTVFLTGGEISREAEVNLKEGRNKLIYTGISTVIDKKSIQFVAPEGVNLISVSTELDYLNLAEQEPRIKTLEDSLTLHKLLKIDLTNEREAFQAEMNLLRSNISIKGSQQNLSAEELRTMAEYYRSRIMSLNKIISEYDRNISSENQKIVKVNQQLSELNYVEMTHSNQVIVLVDVDKNIKVPTQLKYVISNCGWQPNYDLSAQNLSDPILIKYKAKVFNNTGNNWSDVKLTLSTANPVLSASAPVLDAWFLNGRNVNKSFKAKQTVLVPDNQGYLQYEWNASVPQISQNVQGVVGGLGTGAKGTQSPVKFASIDVPQISTEFEIKKKYSIPTDSKPYLVEISEHQLPASFSHKAVPKLDKGAFLLANIVGWEKFGLISGPTNVYYAGTYVGQSYIDTRNVEDTLRLSFGRDSKVLIERKLLEEYSDKKIIGSNKKDTYTYEIVIKNNLNINLVMDLFDQIPISQDSDISISVDEVSNALRNEETGILIWKVNLKPGEVAQYKITFTIKYPEHKNISVKSYRTISCPSF